MKRRKTALMMLSVLMVLAIFLSACSGSKSSNSSAKKSAGKPQQGGDLVVGSIGEPTLLTLCILPMTQVRILKICCTAF